MSRSDDERLESGIKDTNRIALNGRIDVETVEYSYNWSVRGFNSVFRHDRSHSDFLPPGRGTAHQKRTFDWKTGKQFSGSPANMAGQPTIHDVLAEARERQSNHLEELPDPYGFVPQELLRDMVQTS